MIEFERHGRERTNDPDGLSGLMSARVLEKVRHDNPSDIFVFVHGWKGDVNTAKDQYDRWIKALYDRVATSMPRPIYVALHWPSMPWGDEELETGGAGFSTEEGLLSQEDVKQRYVARLGDEPEITGPLDIIFEEHKSNPAALRLSAETVSAYHRLNAALQLGAEGASGAPDADRETFDPQRAFQLAQAETQAAGFGGVDWGGILGPLRQLSFWTMKRRARIVGEGGMHQFIGQIQSVNPEVKIHLMGHSFGSIVVSSILRGPGEGGSLPRPVESAVLVQGAMSLWAYCESIAKAGGKPGYFSRLIRRGAVSGPIVTTRSHFDKAVRIFYPLAAGLLGQVDYAAGDEELDLSDMPTYGGLGSFGICGLRGTIAEQMLPASAEYNFQPGKIYNLEASQYIRKGDGASGAHSDIAGPEVANAIFHAARVNP